MIVHTLVHMVTHIHTHIRTHTYAHTHASALRHAHMNIYMHRQAHTHVYMHTHTYVQEHIPNIHTETYILFRKIYIHLLKYSGWFGERKSKMVVSIEIFIA